MVRISVINRGNGLRERCEVLCGIFLREFGESSSLERLGVALLLVLVVLYTFHI